MNSDIRSKSKTCFRFFLIVGVIFAIFRVYLLATAFNAETGFYAKNTVLPDIFTYGTYIAAALGLLSSLLFTGKTEITRPERTPGTFVAGLLSGLLMLASIPVELLVRKEGDPHVLFLVATVILAIPSAVYFFRNHLKGIKRINPAAFLCYGLIGWCGFTIMRMYFETSLVMNATSKILEEVALVGVLFFLIGDCRSIIGIPKPGFHLGSSYAAMVLLLASVIPDIIGDLIIGLDVSAAAFTKVAELGILIYVICRSHGISCNTRVADAGADETTYRTY